MMNNYLSFYLETREKKRPVESLMASLHLAKKCHPSLKQFFVNESNELIKSLERSIRILYFCVLDLKEINEANNKINNRVCIEQQMIRAKAHLSYYLGEETLNFFIREIENDNKKTPLEN